MHPEGMNYILRLFFYFLISYDDIDLILVTNSISVFTFSITVYACIASVYKLVTHAIRFCNSLHKLLLCFSASTLDI